MDSIFMESGNDLVFVHVRDRHVRLRCENVDFRRSPLKDRLISISLHVGGDRSRPESPICYHLATRVAPVCVPPTGNQHQMEGPEPPRLPVGVRARSEPYMLLEAMHLAKRQPVDDVNLAYVPCLFAARLHGECPGMCC